MLNWNIFSRTKIMNKDYKALELRVAALEAKLEEATNITVYKEDESAWEKSMYLQGWMARPSASIPVKKLVQQLATNVGIVLQYTPPVSKEAGVLINNKS